MEKEKYQAIVIGGGSGGYAAASKLAAYGVSTALVDSSEELGGLCILRGCMPSKALIESANLMRRMRQSAEFGIHVSGLKVSMEEVQERKLRLIGSFQKYRIGQLEEGGFDLIRGEASFIGEREIEVRADGESRKIGFEHAVVATGSVPRVPEIEGLDGVDFWLSHDALNSRVLPEHLVIIGGGAIGCEMAHCFEGLGSKVSIIQRTGCLVGDLGGETSETIRRVSQERGIEVLCSTTPKAVRKEGGRIVVELESDNGRGEVSGTHLLIATGRIPATGRLGLKRAGIETDGNRVVVNRFHQTNQAHVFAVGDAASKHPVVHKAVMDGEEAARNIAIELGKAEGKFQTNRSSENDLFGVFTHPQCANVGMSEGDISASGIETRSARYDFADQGKAEIIGETAGFVAMVCEKETGRILSASAVGPDVIDLIHEIQVAIEARMTAAQLLKIPHYHPTLAEIWTYLAEEIG